jgi:hypothetical protein
MDAVTSQSIVSPSGKAAGDGAGHALEITILDRFSSIRVGGLQNKAMPEDWSQLITLFGVYPRNIFTALSGKGEILGRPLVRNQARLSLRYAAPSDIPDAVEVDGLKSGSVPQFPNSRLAVSKIGR